MVDAVTAEARDPPQYGGACKSLFDQQVHQCLVERPVSVPVVFVYMNAHEDFFAGKFCHVSPLRAVWPRKCPSR